MKTLDKYVAKEALVPFITGFSVVLILLIGNIVYNNINIIVSKIEFWPQLLYYILLQTPYFVMLALPSGALFGCSLAVSRLARDSEITMMRMAGISVKRIFLPLIAISLIISLVAFIFQEKVTSWAAVKSNEILRQLWLAPGAPPIQANVFFRVDNYYFYVNTVNKNEGNLILQDILLYEPPVGTGYPTLTTAKIAKEKNQVWTFENGHTFQINQEGEPVLISSFEKMELNLHQAIQDYILQEEKTPQAMNINELRESLEKLKEGGLETKTQELELGFKLAIPLSSLVLTLCIAPLSLRFGRSGGFMGVLIGIGVLFFYWNVILFSRVLGETGGLPPYLAGWSQLIIFGILGILLLWKIE
ncbi:MAG: LptF/LptG family permease [Armatimonadota bacterium]